MFFNFSKMVNQREVCIKIIKPITGGFATVICTYSGVVQKTFTNESIALDKLVYKYNRDLIGNEREAFDKLFPSQYKELARIIGITEALGHYFIVYNTEKISVEAFNSYIENLKGFVFVDWDVVNGEKKGAQLLYLTDDKENEKGKDALSSFYKAGKISKISYEINDNKGSIFCIESNILDGDMSPFFISLKKKINKALSKRFPG